MAIVVKHGMSAAPVAAAAFGGALGAARAPAERGAAQAAAAAEQQRNALAAQAAQADASRAHDLERMRLGADLREQAADAQQARGREDLEFQLTTRQRMELDQLADAEAQALASDDFTEEEKGEIRRRFAAKRGGIQPVARPKPKSAAELFKERTFTDPKTGAVFALDADGTPGKPIYQPPERQPTVQDRIKAFEAASNLLTGADGTAPDPKRVQAVAKAILRGEEIPEFGSAPDSTPAAAPAGVVVAASAGPAAQPQTIEQRLRALEGDPASVPRDRALDLDEINDLATARLQIADARARMREIQEEINAAKEGGPLRRLWVLRHYNEAKFLEDERLPQLLARERFLVGQAEELQAEQIARQAARHHGGQQQRRQRVRAIDPQEVYEEAAASPAPTSGAADLRDRLRGSAQPPARRIDASLTPEVARRLGERDRAAFEARRKAMAEEGRRLSGERVVQVAGSRTELAPGAAPSPQSRVGRHVVEPGDNSGRRRRRRE